MKNMKIGDIHLLKQCAVCIEMPWNTWRYSAEIKFKLRCREAEWAVNERRRRGVERQKVRVGVKRWTLSSCDSSVWLTWPVKTILQEQITAHDSGEVWNGKSVHDKKTKQKLVLKYGGFWTGLFFRQLREVFEQASQNERWRRGGVLLVHGIISVFMTDKQLIWKIVPFGNKT